LKLQEELVELGAEDASKKATKVARQHEILWSDDISAVFSVIAASPNLAPNNIKSSKDRKICAIEKWVIKYKKGYDGRPSVRVSNPPGTVADPIIELIIKGKLTHLTKADLEKISFAHRLGMSAENILGALLEEYLANNLSHAGWYCAWGETVKSVDFVKKNGELLQIKNRSNSENSSSSSVRDGTNIQKWYRVESKRIEYKWPTLNHMCGIESLSEEGFVAFVLSLLNSNPDALAVEDKNPWKEQLNK